MPCVIDPPLSLPTVSRSVPRGFRVSRSRVNIAHQHKAGGLDMSAVGDDESQRFVGEVMSLVIAPRRQTALQPTRPQSTPAQRTRY